ncbi:MAG: GLPGLI family protein [Flavobacteriia bacterium]|nr:GLPGLI family protein [Flavobacteriia bacterium]
MKKLFLAVFILFSVLISAQESLKITYEGIYSLDETSSETKFPGIFIPSVFELTIGNGLSEFKYIEKLIAEPEGGNPPVPMTSDNYFIDLNANTFFVKQEIFGKNYLVSDTLQKVSWKITREEKEVEGITVRKATLTTDDGDEITAWYAPKLNFKIGPEIYSGLPGLILQLDIYGETQEKAILGRHFKATKIEVLNKNFKIRLPKGKTISFEEAERIADEHFDKILEINKDGVDKD